MNCPKCGAENTEGARFCNGCGAGLTEEAKAGQGVVNETGTTGTGLQKNVAAVLAYVFGWVTGLIFYFIEKDPFVRFHAMQSIIVSGGLTVIYIFLNILFSAGLWRLWWLFSLLYTVIGLLSFGLWLLLMFKAYQGERFKLPVVGNLAEKYAKQFETSI